MTRRKRMFSLVLTVTLVALNLIAVNYLLSGWSGARLDLTEDRLFSISPTTRRIVTSLGEPVTIYGYFSERTHPKLAPLVPQILDVLDEYKAVSRGQVRVEVYDPGEDEDVAQEASDRFGVNSTPFRLASKYETGIVNAYFAVVVRYADQYERYGFDDLIEVEPLPDGDIDVRLRNLEYDLTKAIKKVVHGSQGIEELFEAVPSPVRLTAVVSQATLPEMFASVPQAIETAAAELAEIGGERFEFLQIDPDGDPAAWQTFNSTYGLRPMSLGFFDDRSFYLYGLLEIDGRVEQLMLAGEDLGAAEIREGIEASMRRRAPGAIRTIGVAAPTPLQLPPEIQMQMGMRQPPPEFEDVKRFLGKDFGVEAVDLSAELPVNIDVLLVIKPTEMSELQLYHLDQYLMRGGRVVICSGQFDVNFDGNGLSVAPLESGLDDWLAHHGITIERTLVLDDRNQQLPIPEIRNTVLGQVRTWTMAPYPYLVQVRDDGFVNREVAARLDGVGIYWGSPLTLDDEPIEGLERIPLLQSSAASWTDDDTARASYVEYVVPAEGTAPRLLGVALAGRFESYFKDRGAPAPETADDGTEEQSLPANTVTLDRSPDTRLVVIGNSEFLSDFVARSLNRTEGGFFTENLRFVENVADWVSLDNDMLAIRSRKAGARRLEGVEQSRQIRIEILNYFVPLAILASAGLFIYWRRRNVMPLQGEG